MYKTASTGSSITPIKYFPPIPIVMRQGPFYLGEDTFKEPKGKMIFIYFFQLYRYKK